MIETLEIDNRFSRQLDRFTYLRQKSNRPCRMTTDMSTIGLINANEHIFSYTTWQCYVVVRSLQLLYHCATVVVVIS